MAAQKMSCFLSDQNFGIRANNFLNDSLETKFVANVL